MTEDAEWHKEQCECNKRAYERLVADYADLADWKVVALFYSALHRVSDWFVKQTERDPESNAERNRRVRYELPQVFCYYRDIYRESIRARYRDGFRVTDDRQKAAYALLRKIEDKLPF